MEEVAELLHYTNRPSHITVRTFAGYATLVEGLLSLKGTSVLLDTLFVVSLPG